MCLAAGAVLVAMTISSVASPERVMQAQRVHEAIVMPAPLERWQMDRPLTRPAALPTMYVALGVLQAADLYSTRRALDGRASEANPLMRRAVGNSAAMLAVKALSTAGSIYFTERAWKINRKGAIVMMAVINGVSAAITARNLKNARR